MIYLVDLAAKCHIDLPSALHAKMQKNSQKYPATSMKGNSSKYSLYGDQRSLVGAPGVPPDRAREEGDGSE